MSNQFNQLPQPVRLNKFLAERLGVSRREADELIASGRVKIDGKLAKLGDRVVFASTSDGSGKESQNVLRSKNYGKREEPAGLVEKITCDGKIVPFDTEYVYLAFNKPIGYVCSRRTQGENPTLYELLPKEYQKLKTVGRLDKDSSGLILLTNDGDFAFQMTHPKFRKEKVYEVELDRPLEPLHQQMISDYGVMLDDGPSKFAVVTSTGDGSGKGSQNVLRSKKFGKGEEPAGPVERMYFTVLLSEGRNRQIRRTFAALGYKVVSLHRIQFGKYQLSGLKPGKYVIIKP